MRLGYLRGEMDEATTSAQNLHMIRHFSVIDRYFQLTLSRLRSIDSELAGLSYDPIPRLCHSDQRGIVDFIEYRGLRDLLSRCVHIHYVGAHFLRYKFYKEQSFFGLGEHIGGRHFRGREYVDIDVFARKALGGDF